MNLANVRLIAVDMDGTLLNSVHQASAEFFQLFDQLHDLGIIFVAASGRQYASILDKLPSIRNQISVIAENGALAQHDNKVIVRTVLPTGAQQTVLNRLESRPDIQAVLCSAKNAFVRSDRPEFWQYMSEYYTAHEAVPSLHEVDEPILKIALYHKEHSEREVYPLFKDLQPELEVKVSSPFWVDISHPDANKGFALRKLQAELGISASQTLAIGDYNNDLEMLACADFSFAMANAHPNVKAAARFETTGNDDFGVERVLEKVIQAYPNSSKIKKQGKATT